MASQDFTYKKVSQLPSVSELANADVFIVNHNGVTSKMSWTTLMSIIDSNVTHDVSALTDRVTALETAVSTLGSTVSDLSGTVNNIITAGFNLIGVDTSNN